MIRTEIQAEGQRYYDEPVFVTVATPKVIAVVIADLLGNSIPRELRDLKHYKRHFLKWV